MRSDTARRFKRAIWLQRLKFWGPTLLLAALCFGVAVYLLGMRIQRADPTVEVTELQGSVLEARRASSKAAIFIVHVRLADGQEVDADSTLVATVQKNEHVEIARSRHASGKYSYHVVRVLH